MLNISKSIYKFFYIVSKPQTPGGTNEIPAGGPLEGQPSKIGSS